MIIFRFNARLFDCTCTKIKNQEYLVHKFLYDLYSKASSFFGNATNFRFYVHLKISGQKVIDFGYKIWTKIYQKWAFSKICSLFDSTCKFRLYAHHPFSHLFVRLYAPLFDCTCTKIENQEYLVYVFLYDQFSNEGSIVGNVNNFRLYVHLRISGQKVIDFGYKIWKK